MISHICGRGREGKQGGGLLLVPAAEEVCGGSVCFCFSPVRR